MNEGLSFSSPPLRCIDADPTDRGLLALARHEGIVPAPYLDVKRVWTFGVGHTAAPGAPDPADAARHAGRSRRGIAEAFRLFRADLARYEAECCAP